MNKQYRNLSAMLLALFLATGCETSFETDDDSADDGSMVDGGATGADGSDVQTGTLQDDFDAQLDPLDDPQSTLAQRVILFEFDRSNVSSSYLPVLEEHARHLVANPNLRVRLEGHADERGTREYNIGLGDRRNQSVRRILMFNGVTDDQITTVSYGEERPVATGHDESDWAQNRRVELVYIR